MPRRRKPPLSAETVRAIDYRSYENRYWWPHNTELVPFDVIWGYREYDRAGQSGFADKNIKVLVESLKRTGFTAPLMLEYATETQTALLGEGNHRLAAAKILGIREIPVRVYRRTSESRRHESSRDWRLVPRPPKDRDGGYTGYIKSELKPSELGIQSRPLPDDIADLDGRRVDDVLLEGGAGLSGFNTRLWDFRGASSSLGAISKRAVTERDLKRFVADEECYEYAELVQKAFPQLAYDSGFYVKPRGGVADHAWTRGPDGTIYDTTYGQFNTRMPIGIWPAGSKEAKRYRSWDEHHSKNKPNFCLLRTLKRDEPCDAPGCTWKGVTT